MGWLGIVDCATTILNRSCNWLIMPPPATYSPLLSEEGLGEEAKGEKQAMPMDNSP